MSQVTNVDEKRSEVVHNLEHLFLVGEFPERGHLLSGLTLEQVTLCPDGASHSIYEELWHVVAYQQSIIEPGNPARSTVVFRMSTRNPMRQMPPLGSKVVDEKGGTPVNAINPDLRAFKARGGKLLLYHGWNDTAISAGNTINYYSSVLSKMGKNQDEWIRLFMAPGMQHCGNGPGPNQVNWMAVLERWRESGTAPDRIEAARVTNNRVDMTRPLCPYPQVAQYKGVGSTNDAANFVCRQP